MKRIKQYFNLIEIALAIAIIAVGMSSIMVLFPAGVNASNTAAANNMIPDVADYVLSYLECTIQASWRDAAGYAQANTVAGKFASSQGTEDDDDHGAATSGWNDIPDTNLEYRDDFSSSSRIFRYTQSYDITTPAEGTITVTDFQAVIRVWVEPIPLRLRRADTGALETGTTQTVTNANAYAMALCAEISYPAGMPYAEREKHLFRREIFNHAPVRP